MSEKLSSQSKRCSACAGEFSARPLFTKWELPIYRCPSCGTGVVEPPPGFDPARIYDEGYFSGARRDSYPDYRASEPVLRREFQSTVRALVREGQTGSLLEIGSAYGVFLEAAREHFAVAGIELSAAAAGEAAAKGLDVKVGALSDAVVRDIEPVETIVMLDVIEHLPDPEEAVRICREKLKPGGLLLLTTGDFGSAASRIAGRHWRLMTPGQHLFFFTRRGLAELLLRSGFEIRRVRYPWKFVPLGVILFQLFRTVGLKVTVPKVLLRLPVPINLFDAMEITARKRF